MDWVHITPKLVTTRRSILGPPAEGRPGPSDDDDDADIYLPLLRTHHGNTPAAIPRRGWTRRKPVNSEVIFGWPLFSHLNSNFTHMKQIQNCIFYQYFASPSLTRDQFACPVFCLQTRIFCHKIYFGLQTRIFCYKNIFCLPTTFADECFCLQAEIFFQNFVCLRTATFGDEYCCL